MPVYALSIDQVIVLAKQTYFSGYVVRGMPKTSALGLQGILGLGSYRIVWAWLHKLRTAMVRPGRDLLSGTVEVDETLVGGTHTGKRERGTEGKELVLIAVEDNDKKGVGRIRLKHIPDASGSTLEKSVVVSRSRKYG